MATDSPTGQENKRSLYCISNFFVNLRLFHVCFKLKQQNKTRINCIAFRNVIVFETHFFGAFIIYPFGLPSSQNCLCPQAYGL